MEMKQIFTASTWQEGEWHIAQCVEVDVASQGVTEDEALENLRDALELHFTPPVAPKCASRMTCHIGSRSIVTFLIP